MPKKTATKTDSRTITEPLPQSFFKKSSMEAKGRSIGGIISREITHYTIVFLSLCLVFLILTAIWFYSNYSNQKQRWLAARDNLAYWEEVAEIQKNSPEAYYQAAVYSIELGDRGKAQILLQKALSLDSGFDKAKKLQEQLTGKGK